jgi:hypothetical protein
VQEPETDSACNCTDVMIPVCSVVHTQVKADFAKHCTSR